MLGNEKENNIKMFIFGEIWMCYTSRISSRVIELCVTLYTNIWQMLFELETKMCS